MKYRKKPVMIEAWQMPLSLNEFEEIVEKSSRKIHIRNDDNGNQTILCETLEGDHIGTNDDWIILGVENEVYPCKDSVFKATYEEI